MLVVVVHHNMLVEEVEEEALALFWWCWLVDVRSVMGTGHGGHGMDMVMDKAWRRKS